MQHELEFTFDRAAVGYFMESTCPRIAGRYRYMPYRGIGHYELHAALREGKNPRCFMSDHAEVSFIVLSCPEYGVLELSEFLSAGDIA